MEEQYPLWLLLHPFLDFLAENVNKDVPIRDHSWFSRALHLLTTVFWKYVLLRIIAEHLALQAPFTDTPYKNCWQLPSAAIVSEFFLRTHPRHHQKNEQVKTASRNKMFIKFIFLSMDGWQCQNKDHANTVPKNLWDMFSCYIWINIKKRAGLGSVLQDRCWLHEQN